MMSVDHPTRMLFAHSNSRTLAEDEQSTAAPTDYVRMVRAMQTFGNSDVETVSDAGRKDE